MELKTSFDFDFKAKAIGKHTSESTVFVSHIDYNDDSIACSGNGFVKLYDLHNGQVVTYFGTGQKALSDMQFASQHPNLLCTASSINGVIAIYDVRCNNKSNSKSKSKQICLLHSPNKRKDKKALYSVTMDDHTIVGSGTQDIYLWDRRTLNRNQTRCCTLESYHCDDVTKVRFNPLHSHETDTHLFSISEDTLMNEYNVRNIHQGGCGDALVHTYSLEKELWHFGFFEQNKRALVYALTNDESLIVQSIHENDEDADMEDVKDAEPQPDNTRVFNSNTLDHMTLIDCFYDPESDKQNLCLLSCNKEGKLRLSNVSYASNTVSIVSESIDGHHARIRCAKYIPKIGCFLTGGEDNTVSMWKYDPNHIKSQTITQSNPQQSTPVHEQKVCSGYGAHRTSPNANNTKHNVKHFRPY